MGADTPDCAGESFLYLVELLWNWTQ